MRIFKFCLLIFFFALISTSTYSQQTELTLKQIITEAFKNNINIVKSEDAIASQESIIKSSYNDVLPSLSFSSGWTRSNQVSHGLTNVGGVNVDLGTQNTTTNNYSLSLRSDITLFNGFTNYEKIESAKKVKAKLLTQVEKVKQDIVIKLMADYITVLKNKQIVKINIATLEDSKAQLEKIKIFVEVGKRTQADVYRQDVVVAQNELAVEQSKNNENKSMADLLFDANLSQEKNYTVNPNEFPTEYAFETLQNYVDRNSYTEQLVNNAVKYRYDYKAGLQNIDILNLSEEMTRNQLLFPSLTGFSSYSLSGNQIQNIDNSRIFTIGLSLTYPIFQGFQIDNQRQQAMINVKMAREDLDQLKNQMTVDIKKTVLDLRSLLKQIEITDRSLKSAEQDMIAAEESYRVGIGTILDVNTAALKYNNALIDKSNVIYNFILAQKQLEYYQGILKY